MRDPAQSPFTPGYGILPAVWAGREREFDDFDEVVAPRVRGRVYEQARIITGNRGVGKTVFLTQLAEEAHAAGDLVAHATARAGTSVLTDLVGALAAELHRASAAAAITDAITSALQRRVGLSVGTKGVELDVGAAPEPPSVDTLATALNKLLERAAREAADRGGMLLVTVDETQNAALEAVGVLCHAFAQTQAAFDRAQGPRGEPVRKHLPLAVYVAGLTSLPDRIRRSGSTFFERALPFDFGLLRDPDVAVAVRQMLGNVDVGIEADALDRMVGLVGGFPFFLHLYGKHAWQAGDGQVITTAEVEQAAVTAAVDLTHFYGERLRGLGTLAYDWLVAAARLDEEEHTVGNVAEQLGRTSAQLGSTVDSLLGRGLIRREPGRGRFSFALPGLDAHLRSSPGR